MTATSAFPKQLQETEVVHRLSELSGHSFNRASAYLHHQDALSGHHRTRAEVLDELVADLTAMPAAELLQELRSAGLLWSVVAEVVGVTDAAVRKWRKGHPIESRHHERLARLVAFSRLHAAYARPGAPTAFGEWLDTPVISTFSATPLRLLALNRDSDLNSLQPLLDWMLDHPDGDHAEGLLDRYLGDAWRGEAREEQRFRIVTNAAGERVLLIDD